MNGVTESEAVDDNGLQVFSLTLRESDNHLRMGTRRLDRLCRCGSGKKFKHCHYRGKSKVASNAKKAVPHRSMDLQRTIKAMQAHRLQSQNQQGLGRGIISSSIAGHRIVAVGAKTYYSKDWKTFHDFLRSYLIGQLGDNWFKAERAKPELQRHQIVCWFEKAWADAKRLGVEVDGVRTSPMTGAGRAFLNLAYNIYLIAHHAEPSRVDQLVGKFINKLKSDRTDDFIGTLFETYAAAAFLKAGFNIEYEDETGSRPSVEFIAIHPETGKKFSVEVKSRNRSVSEDGPVDDVRRLRVASKLNKALAKSPEHTQVVMIEVNVPDVLTGTALEGWPAAALKQIKNAENYLPEGVQKKPSAYVFVTNHAFHNNLDAVEAGVQILAAGCSIPDFGPDTKFGRLKDVLENEKRHREMLALMDSMRTHYEIPATFDGGIPELVFGSDRDMPRLKFGEWYTIPGPDGAEVKGRLYEAAVLDRSVHGVYETSSGRHIVCTTPLTDQEYAAWKKHPETFFGEVRQETKKVDNWLQLASFFHETYKTTPREKLLEWMSDASDIEELTQLSQAELAIKFCERAAWTAELNKSAREQNED